jgi:hypothetical protein
VFLYVNLTAEINDENSCHNGASDSSADTRSADSAGCGRACRCSGWVVVEIYLAWFKPIIFPVNIEHCTEMPYRTGAYCSSSTRFKLEMATGSSPNALLTVKVGGAEPGEGREYWMMH